MIFRQDAGSTLPSRLPRIRQTFVLTLFLEKNHSLKQSKKANGNFRSPFVYLQASPGGRAFR